MARGNDTDFENYDPTKPPPEAKLYGENVSHAQRFKSTFDSSKMVGADGKFLGMSISPAMAGTFRFLWNQTLPEVADYLGNHSVQASQNFVRKFVTQDPAKVLEYGNKMGKVLPPVVLFMQQEAELAANAYNTSKSLKELQGAISFVTKASGKSPGGGVFTDTSNEVIHNARQKIFKSSMNDLISTAAGTVAVIPSLMMLHKKEKAKLAENVSEAEFEYIAKHGTEEQKREFLQKQVKANMATTRNTEGILRDELAKEKKAYEDRFKDFKREKGREASKAIAKAKEEGDLYNLKNKYEIGRSSGYDMSRMSGSGNNKSGADAEAKLTKQLEQAWLKDEFVKKEGAWSKDWYNKEDRELYYGYSRGRRGDQGVDRPKTYEEILTESHRKMIDRMNGVSADGKKSGEISEKTTDHITQAFFALGAETLRNFTTKDANKSLKGKLALDMILGMRRALDENPERETIPGASEQNQEEEYSYALFVHRVFQQNQHDSGLAEIGDRYVKSMKAVSWDDKDIQSMKDSDLNAYEVAIKHISQYIRDGRMDPLALINLAGERKIVQKSGKSFGTLQTNDAQALKENIIEEIDHQAALLKPKHKMDDDEVSKAMANYTFTKEELQAAFSNHGLDPDAKAFMFALLDMNTPDDTVLKDLTGRSDEEIKKLRMDSQKHFSTQLDAALREISEDLANNPAAPERYNLSEDEAQVFQHVYQEAQKTGASIGDVLNKENRKMVDSAVANILVDDSLQHGGSFWRDRVKPHAKQTVVQNQEEGRMKEEQRKSAVDSFEPSGGFADKVSGSGKSANDDYLDNMPYVSKNMQNGFDGPAMKSYANQGAGSQEYGLAT